jgi:hypothetical protein
VSLIDLKLSRSTNSAATGVWFATRAREHLLDAIEDQGAVGQPGQRVVCREERELLLAPRELSSVLRSISKDSHIRTRLLPDLAGDLCTLARHPAGDGDGRDRADAGKALLDHGVRPIARLASAQQHRADDVLSAGIQCLPETV